MGPPDDFIVNGVSELPADISEKKISDISHEQPADIVSAEELDQEQSSREILVENKDNCKQIQIHPPDKPKIEYSSLSTNTDQEKNILPNHNPETEDTKLQGEPDANSSKIAEAGNIIADTTGGEIVSNESSNHGKVSEEDQNKLPLLKRNLSQELIVIVEKTPEVKVATESLPEVLIVAEKLPEIAAVGDTIPLVNSTRQLKRGQSVNQEDNISQYDDDVDVDDGGSTLTIGRTDTLSKQSEGNEVLHIESGKEEEKWQKKQTKQSHREEHVNEYCISPFFTVVYLLLGCLIIALIGVNFWFGFHLLLLIALLAVIALLVLLLTEFSEFHNLSI